MLLGSRGPRRPNQDHWRRRGKTRTSEVSATSGRVMSDPRFACLPIKKNCVGGWLRACVRACVCLCVCVFDIGYCCCHSVPDCASWWSSMFLFWIFVIMYIFFLFISLYLFGVLRCPQSALSPVLLRYCVLEQKLLLLHLLFLSFSAASSISRLLPSFDLL